MNALFFPLFILLLETSACIAQENLIISGRVLDSKTKQPLVNANIGLKGLPYGTVSDMQGNFELSLPNKFLHDTLFVSYIGYRSFIDRVSNVGFTKKLFLLEETSTVLDEVTVLGKKPFRFEIKKTEASMKLIKGNLYAGKTEVTNEEYNLFLNYLLQSNQTSLYNQYKPDISQYEGTLLAFFKGYHLPHPESKKATFNKDYDNHPVVNIPYEAAVAYCEWLTESYNTHSGKKKFTNVRFRLPTLKEWQIAALGYPKFQSWELEENEVEVRVPEHPSEEVAVKKRTIPVKGNDILYPWFHIYHYRNTAQNNKNCWLGNFKVPPESVACEASRPAGDGYPITAPVASYFPNGMGLYDVVGNVAEMINEKGKACGGSWDHLPEESTLVSINQYSGSGGSVGLRIFMEVISEK